MRATLGRRSFQCLILAVLCIMSASCATLPVGDKASKDDEGIVVFSIMPRSYTAIDENQVREVRPIFDTGASTKRPGNIVDLCGVTGLRRDRGRAVLPEVLQP